MNGCYYKNDWSSVLARRIVRVSTDLEATDLEAHFMSPSTSSSPGWTLFYDARASRPPRVNGPRGFDHAASYSDDPLVQVDSGVAVARCQLHRRTDRQQTCARAHAHAHGVMGMDMDMDIKKYGMMGVNKEGDEAEESQIARLLIFTW